MKIVNYKGFSKKSPNKDEISVGKAFVVRGLFSLFVEELEEVPTLELDEDCRKKLLIREATEGLFEAFGLGFSLKIPFCFKKRIQ